MNIYRLCILTLFISCVIENSSAQQSKTRIQGIIESIEGAQQKFIKTDDLETGDTTFLFKDKRIYYKFTKGTSYGIVACGGNGVTNIDLGLVSKSGKTIVKQDIRMHETGVIGYTPSSDIELQVVVALVEGNTPKSDFTVWIGEIKKSTSRVGQKINLDLSAYINDSSGNKRSVTLREMMGSNKALYFRLWADWCVPCIELLPQLKYREQVLTPHNIAVVAVENELWNGGPGGDPFKTKRSLENAGLNMIKPYYEKPTSEIYKALKINAVPQTAVIKSDGTILFIGHPMSSNLADVIKQLGVTNFDLRRKR